MKNIKNKKGFTFVELVIVVVILAILGAIGFSAFSGTIGDSRDAQRKSDMASISSAMKLYKKQKGVYPMPDKYFSITNGGDTDDKIVAYQGRLSSNVGLSTLDNIPQDPLLKIPYYYSITKNKQEFQLAGALENGDMPISIVAGSYKSVAKTVLPTLILALESSDNIEIQDGTGEGSENRKKFIFNGNYHNLPYIFEGGIGPVSDGTDFDTLLEEAEESGNFIQNSSFETCDEIKDSGKFIGDGDYQLRTSTGALKTENCSF